jgi:hypothetical protein
MQDFIVIRDKILHKTERYWIKGDNESFIITESYMTQSAL